MGDAMRCDQCGGVSRGFGREGLWCKSRKDCGGVYRRDYDRDCEEGSLNGSLDIDDDDIDEAVRVERERCLDVARVIQYRMGLGSEHHAAVACVIEAIKSGGVECDGCAGTGRITDTGEWCGRCDGSGWHV